MGSIKHINDKIWIFLLDFTSKISDNVYIQILIVISLFSVIWFAINYILEQKFSKLIIPFGPVSMLLCVSTGYMTQRLPVIHERMNKALSICSSIVESSKTYLDAFEQSSNIIVKSSTDIASYLYFLEKEKRNTWNCAPTELYESIFRTLDKIRGGWILPDVHMPCFAEFSITFILCIVTIIFMGIIIINTKPRKYRTIIYILQSAFLVYTTTISNGAFICAMLLWLIEEICYGILNIKD